MGLALGLLAVACVAVLALLLLGFLAVGFVAIGAIAAAAISLKLLPVVFVVWLILRLVRGGAAEGRHRVPVRRRYPVSTSDDAWLDTRG